MREGNDARSGCDAVSAKCLFYGGCPLVDINLEYKDLHTLYPLSWIHIYMPLPQTPFNPNSRFSSTSSPRASHCSWVHIYSKLLFIPHKVKDHLHYPELCPLVGFFLATIFQVHSWLRLQGSCHPFSAACTHTPSLVFVFLCQLVIHALSWSPCSHGYELSEGCQHSGGWRGDLDHLLMQFTCASTPAHINPKCTASILQWIAVGPAQHYDGF